MGQIKADPQFYGYISYILEDNGLLRPISDVNETVWGIKPKGNISTAGFEGKSDLFVECFHPEKKSNSVNFVFRKSNWKSNQLPFTLQENQF
jgi:hypothetical protein